MEDDCNQYVAIQYILSYILIFIIIKVGIFMIDEAAVI